MADFFLNCQECRLTTNLWSSRAEPFVPPDLGTGKFSSPEAMRDALAASGAELVTLALRRADLSGQREPVRENPGIY